MRTLIGRHLFAVLCMSLLGGAASLVAAPDITQPPAQRTVVQIGEALSLSVEASGIEPLTYQWKKNGYAIPGATEARYHKSSVAPDDAGYYTIEVTDAKGATSRAVSFVLLRLNHAEVIVAGDNELGQLEVPYDIAEAVAVEVGPYHSLALNPDGTVAAWGDNYHGQTDVPEGLDEVVSIAAGDSHSLALRANGEVVAWGSNHSGKTDVPEDLTDVVAIEAADYASFAIKSDGSVVVWGATDTHYDTGYKDVPEGLDSVVAIATASGRVYALKENGTIVAWGNRLPESMPDDLSGISQVAAGSYVDLALKSDGTVIGWGHDTSFDSAALAELSDIQTIAVGYGHWMALTKGGMLKFDGAYWGFLPASLGGLDNIAAISSRHTHVLALREQPPVISAGPIGATRAIGDRIVISAQRANDVESVEWQKNGEPIDGATGLEWVIEDATEADSGTYRLVAITAFGTATSNTIDLTVRTQPWIKSVPDRRTVIREGDVLELQIKAESATPLTYQWKRNGLPITGETTDTFTKSAASVADSAYYSVDVTDGSGVTVAYGAFVAVRLEKPQVVGWGEQVPVNRTLQTPGVHGQSMIPHGLQGAISISAGPFHSLALQADGTVVAWGNNADGESNVPTSLEDVVEISAHRSLSMALRSDGTALAWGKDAFELNAFLGKHDHIVSIEAGAGHAYVIKEDGTVAIWGRHFNSVTPAIEPPVALIPAAAISTSASFSIGLSAAGKIHAWGRNDYGESSAPGVTAPLRSISAGGHHGLLLSASGFVQAWGSNDLGQRTVPTGLSSNVVAISAGTAHSLAVKNDGTPFAWGSNEAGQTSIPVGVGRIVGIAAGELHSLAIRDASSDLPPKVFLTSSSDPIMPVGGTIRMEAAITGWAIDYQWHKDGAPIPGAHSPVLVIDSANVEDSGTYRFKVSNYAGAVETPPIGITVKPPPRIEEGPSQRNVYHIGDDLNLRVRAVAESSLTYLWKHNGKVIEGETSDHLSRIVRRREDAGYYTVEVSDQDGLTSRATGFVVVPLIAPFVRAWGSNYEGEATIPPNLEDVIAISAGNAFSLALTADGYVRAWGANGRGVARVPENLDQVVAIAAGTDYVLALRADGTVASWGRSSLSPEMDHIVEIAAGDDLAFALDDEGSVTVWDPREAASDGLREPPKEWRDNILHLLDRGRFAIRSDGNLLSWNEEQNPSISLNHITAVVASYGHAVALDSRGYLSAWAFGSNPDPELPPSLLQTIAITAGRSDIYAILPDHSIVGWNFRFSPAYIPSDLRGVVAIEAGNQHILALCEPFLPLAAAIHVSETEVRLIYQRPFETDDLTYGVEASGDLIVWTPISAEHRLLEIHADNETWDAIVTRVPQGASYFRLVVNRK